MKNYVFHSKNKNSLCLFAMKIDFWIKGLRKQRMFNTTQHTINWRRKQKNNNNNTQAHVEVKQWILKIKQTRKCFYFSSSFKWNESHSTSVHKKVHFQYQCQLSRKSKLKWFLLYLCFKFCWTIILWFVCFFFLFSFFNPILRIVFIHTY